MNDMNLAWLGFNNSQGSFQVAFMTPSNIRRGAMSYRSLIYHRMFHKPSEVKIYRRLTRLLLSATKTGRYTRKKEIKESHTQ